MYTGFTDSSKRGLRAASRSAMGAKR